MRLTVSLFSALSRALDQIPNAFALAQDIELEKKTRLHGRGARFLSAVHADLLIMEAQVDSCKLSWRRDRQSYSVLSM